MPESVPSVSPTMNTRDTLAPGSAVRTLFPRLFLDSSRTRPHLFHVSSILILIARLISHTHPPPFSFSPHPLPFSSPSLPLLFPSRPHPLTIHHPISPNSLVPMYPFRSILFKVAQRWLNTSATFSVASINPIATETAGYGCAEYLVGSQHVRAIQGIMGLGDGQPPRLTFQKTRSKLHHNSLYLQLLD